MTATLLVILGSVAAVAVLSAAGTWLLHRSHGKLALVGQAPAAPQVPRHPNRPTLMLTQVGQRRGMEPAETCWISGLTKTEAEDCLDWLEANGYAHREVALRGDGFAISYQ